MNIRIEGYAIVSDDGMLADEQGVMPASLKIGADQAFLSDSLDRADLIVHGRHSHEGQPSSPQRRRILVSRRVAALGPTSDYPNAVLWNPAGLSLEKAMDALDMEGGTVAILGGTDVFGLFLPRYDVFHLSRAAGVWLPRGRPVFPQVPERTPEDILAACGFVPGAPRVLDAARAVSLVSWTRAPRREQPA